MAIVNILVFALTFALVLTWQIRVHRDVEGWQ